MEVSYQLLAPITLTPEKDPPVHIGWQVNWAPGLCWTLWRRGNRFILPETNFLPSNPYHIAIPTELSSLQCFRHNTKYCESLITVVIELDGMVLAMDDGFEYIE
jgi:hypothetical protein